MYVSLDEARSELRRRWQDEELRRKIESELGINFWPQFKHQWSALWRPANGNVDAR